MKLTRLLSLGLALPFLALLSACGGEDSEAAHEVEKPMTEGIAKMQQEREAKKEAFAESEQGPYKNPENVSGGAQIINKKLTLKLDVPSPAWSVKITEVWIVGEEMWALATLSENKEGLVSQVVTEAQDSVTVDGVPDLPVSYYVIGKTFNWEKAGPNVKFIKTRNDIATNFAQASQVYPQSE